MQRFKLAIAVIIVLAPLSGALADNEETQLLHTNTYQEVANVTCASSGNCDLFFPATTHSTTVITNLSCALDAALNTNIYTSSIRSVATSAAFYVQPFYYGNVQGSAEYAINSVVNLFIAKGDVARVNLFLMGGSNNNFLTCTISGYHA